MILTTKLLCANYFVVFPPPAPTKKYTSHQQIAVIVLGVSTHTHTHGTYGSEICQPLLRPYIHVQVVVVCLARAQANYRSSACRVWRITRPCVYIYIYVCIRYLNEENTRKIWWTGSWCNFI